MSDKKYPKDYFSLVQDNNRLLDKALQTKQLTYFQDALLRFTKNKYNLIASIILLILILLSITVPMITPKELYTETNSYLTTLPPRVPILANYGIFDGTKDFTGQPIDVTTIDPETGLGYPTGLVHQEYILMDTLKNYVIVGSERSELYVGGTNDLYINFNKKAFSIQSPSSLDPSDLDKYVVNIIDGTTIDVDINYLDEAGVLEVYFLDSSVSTSIESWDEPILLDTITTAGTYSIDPSASVTAGAKGKLVLKYVLDEVSIKGSEYVSFDSIVVNQLEDEDDLVFDGYVLSSFDLVVVESDENGRFLRKNAEMTVADFTYDSYAALFRNSPRTIGAVEYQEILDANPGMVDTIVVDPDNPKAWTFDDDYPLAAVTNVDTISIAGEDFSNYQVLMSGKYAIGYDSAPYFLFGTDVFGQDLFTLIWLGLRTSLLLGFLASLTNIILGVIWGAFSAYYGGQVDILMERFTDIWGSFPQITMIGIITVLIGPGFTALYIFMVYDGWIGVAKITRLQFYRYKGREYVLAARTLGASDKRIIFKHILPNTLGTIVTRVILSIPSVIFLEVTLSYLGFGIGNGQSLSIGPVELTGTSIGVILNDGQQQIFAGNYWLIVWPTIIVAVLMITFNMFGNALRDALNPQLRGSE